MDRGKKLIGILLILISISALFAWEKWGKQQLIYEDVLVFRENVEKGTIIREHMLTSVKMDLRETGWITPKQKGTVVGKETTCFIHKGMPLFSQYFSETELAVSSDNGRYVLSVPQEWIDSIPSTLTKGNRAYFYCEGRFVTAAAVASFSAESESVEVIVTGRQAERLSALAAEGRSLVIVYN